MIPLAEKPFLSIQGEGRSCGKLSLFIRVAGCNLRCSWCDSKFTWRKGKIFLTPELIEPFLKTTNRIVLTGGEPLLYGDKFRCIFTFDNTVEIETNGTIPPPSEFFTPWPVLYSVSPKTEDISYNVLSEFKKVNSIFKFVINNEDEFNSVLKVINEVGISREVIWLMPQGTSQKEIKKKSLFLLKKCLQYGFNLSPRYHITLFGKKRGV